MKKSISEYINALSDGDFDILEEIFCEKYNQMLDLYWLIREYSDVTSSLTYNRCEESEVLKIEMTLVNVKPKDVIKTISSSCEEKGNVNVWNVGSVIHIEIKDESETD